MGDGVAPRRNAAVGAEELAVAGPELDPIALTDGFPLDGRVEPSRKGLGHFPAGHAEEVRLVRGGEVAAVAALEADDGLVALEAAAVAGVLDSPPGVLGGPISILGHRVLVFVGVEVLVVVALQPDGGGVVEEVHCCLAKKKKED